MWKVETAKQRKHQDIGEVTLRYLDHDGNPQPHRITIPCHILNDPPITKTVDDVWVASALYTLANHIQSRGEEYLEQDILYATITE